MATPASSPPNRIAVWGAGAWGSALANVAARAGRDVILWTRHAAAADALHQTRSVPQLPDATLDTRIIVTSDLAQAAQADAVLVVVPAQAVRGVVAAFAPHLRAGTPLVACAKGIENTGNGGAQFMTEVIAQSAPQARPAILSGPSFASDVMRGLPTAVTLAAADEALARTLAHALGSATFRPYHSADVRGVEIGGAAKNVLAIAAGIVAGRGLGASAQAALTTRGFAELFRFGEAFGAKAATLTGLSGLGDLVLTCASTQSRNFAHGVMLGEGRGEHSGKLAEGVFTAPVLARMARARDIDMPIASAVAAILDNAITIDEAIDSLLTRPFRAED